MTQRSDEVKGALTDHAFRIGTAEHSSNSKMEICVEPNEDSGLLTNGRPKLYDSRNVIETR